MNSAWAVIESRGRIYVVQVDDLAIRELASSTEPVFGQYKGPVERTVDFDATQISADEAMLRCISAAEKLAATRAAVMANEAKLAERRTALAQAERELREVVDARARQALEDAAERAEWDGHGKRARAMRRAAQEFL